MTRPLTLADFSLLPLPWGPRPATPKDLIDVARHAEDLGFYAFTLAHEPLMYHADEQPELGSQIWRAIPPELRDHQHDALVLLPMIAQATSSIRIGFNILVTPWVHPFVWAKYLASLDVATGGRVIAGFGLGDGPAKGPIKSLDNLGIDSKQRGDMSDEALEQITRLWTSRDLVSFEGRFYKGVGLAVEPKPLQSPYPELWWAGHSEKSIRRAARYAKYLELVGFTLQGNPYAAVRDNFGPRLRAANEAAGGSAQLAAFIYANVLPETPSRERLSDAYWGWTGDTLDSVAAGTPERCAEVIRAFHDAGVEHFILDLHRHGLDHVGRLHEQMEAFATRVVPLLA